MTEDLTPNKIKILVVDDDMVTRLVISRLLQKAGYKDVVVIDSAIEALQLINKMPFQLIISDVKMPVMDGIEFLEKLKNDEILAKIPVIMMSAIDELQLVYNCLQVGACDFLTKPIKLRMVQNLWQNVWRKRNELRMLEQIQNIQIGSRTQEELQTQLKSLHEQVDKAVSIPLRAISDTLSKLISSGSIDNSVRETLGKILKTLQNSDIYRGAVDAFIQEKFCENLDTQTREWFAREFSLASKVQKKKCPLSTTTSTVISDSELTETLRNWEFNVWKIPDDNTMYKMIKAMFNEFGLLQYYKIDTDNFQNFLIETRKKYSEKNPYHNFRHAFDVIHMIYLLLTNAKASEYLTMIETFTLLLTGLLHDVEHPGLNNNFLILTSSELSLIYNDQSVLENHHCSTGYRLLLQYNILQNLSKEDKSKFRSLMIDMILSTDMAKHMKSLVEFQTLLDGNNGTINKNIEEHRSILCKMLLKCADLCNPTKSFSIAKYWAEMIQEEFFMQGDQEIALGLPRSPFMERGNSSLPLMQVNFTTYIVIPLYQEMGKVLTEIEKKILPLLLDNREKWNKLLNK